ncbi:uncharacterized protein LKV04_020561 [Tautogolabrus adspersus]
MSAASCMFSEEQFLCSICLDVFTDPVSIPCGHNFCKSCITHHWDVSNQCECPICKDVFEKRPELRVNTFISEMAAQFRQSTVKKSSRISLKKNTNSGEVLCDVCTETKVKALKSCLMCLTSYCETHLEIHQNITGQMKHELVDPLENLQDRMCESHGRPLEMFCRTDQMCVCLSCTESNHKLHCIVPLMEQYEKKTAELTETEAEIQKMIEERRLKIQKMKDSVELSRADTDREKSDSVEVFTALIRSVEEGLAQLLDLLEEKQKTTEEKAEGFIRELEDEISELMKRNAEVQQLLSFEDHLQFLQNLPSLNPAPTTKDWTHVRVHSSYEGTVRRAVAQLEEKLSEEVKKQLESELRKVQQYAVDVTLDPDTASSCLILSNNRKQVYYGKKQDLPDNPERFSKTACVFGKQSFSAGKFYFEVEVKNKTKWELGVARGSIYRKETISPSRETGPWILMLRNGSDYKAVGLLLSLKSQPQKVGVFVDYEEGVVSFYDVDAAAFIYSFTGCNFTEKLFPIFGPCTNDSGDNRAPLIITPVIQTDANFTAEEEQQRLSVSEAEKGIFINSFTCLTSRSRIRTEMSAASCTLSEEQFLCSICLDVFTDPVSIPCGHNFCKSCITHHWDVSNQCECPTCKDVFEKRPELRVNTFISEMAAQFRHSAVKRARRCSVQRSSSSGEVLCDVCTGTKLKAHQSCLVCLTSYCEIHLEFHQKMIGLTKHELVDPVENLQDRMCESHGRPLEMFCRTDQMCVCLSCTESNHKLHCIVPLMEQYEKKTAELTETEAEIQKMIEERRLKIQKMKDSVELSRADTDREKSDSVEVFTALIRSVEEGLAQLVDLLEEKQKTTEEKAEGFIRELEDEISELIKRNAEVQQLSSFEEHLQFLQNLPSLNPAPTTKDWTHVRVHSSYEGTVRSAVAQLEKELSEEVKKQLKSELRGVQQYAVDVTLDPETAHRWLDLSYNGKKVFYSKSTDRPDNSSQRFGWSECVLGEQSFSAGKSYYEVKVGRKSDWEIGVARGSMNRQGNIYASLETGPWTLMLRKGSDYKAVGLLLSLKSEPQKVGVFVDYEEGVVSFYDVNAAAFIYSLTGCNFTEKLYPYFRLYNNDSGKNRAPLIITPVIQTQLVWLEGVAVHQSDWEHLGPVLSHDKSCHLSLLVETFYKSVIP